MVAFALKTLLADRGKLLTALIGVVFALVLVNVQGGLYFGLIRKASLLIDHSDVDIWVARHGVENVDLPGEIPEAWLDRIRGLPGVAAADPYIIGSGTMTLKNGGYEAVWIVGSDPRSLLGSAWEFAEGGRADLHRPDAVAVDEIDDRKLGHPEVGDIVEISGRRARIAAKTRGTLNFMTTPVVFTTLEAARRYALLPEGYCSYFLVQAAGGSDLEALRDAIRQRVPDLDVYTADEFRELSQSYWMHRTGIGLSFGGATVLGVLVGMLMVSQSLYTLALDHLNEYATLKAMGADDRQVGSVVFLQSLTIAAVGCIGGVALTLLVQRSASSPMTPIEIPPELLAGGIALVCVICLLASILPFLRIRRIDPATVLQG